MLDKQLAVGGSGGDEELCGTWLWQRSICRFIDRGREKEHGIERASLIG
jgi:hypothetical protein